MPYHHFADFEDSSSLISQPLALRERFDRLGYIFVRGIVDLDWIAWARGCYKEVLAAQGLVDPAVEAPVWTGKRPERPPSCDSLGDKVWRKFISQSPANDVVAKVLGEKPYWLPIVRHRCTLPSEPLALEADPVPLRHQDGFFNAGLDFMICWLPLMDIPRDRGGLAIAVGMHKKGYLHDTVEPFKIPREAIPQQTWSTTHFRPGDLLMFHRAIPHAGLANHTDQVRLSMDIRVLPESAARPIIGKVKSVDTDSVLIHTDEDQDVRVSVTAETFIRNMNPSVRVELKSIAYEGARVLAMTDDERRASVIRSIAY
jgi:ectoine hydroxylase-related dioxygenase (phytanoyl-CoA dioxygenase family)